MANESGDDRDWRAALWRQLRTEFRFVYDRKSKRKRMMELTKDKEYLYQKHIIERELQEAYTLDPVGVTKVLRLYRFGPDFGASAQAESMKTIRKRLVRKALDKYRAFTTRFQLILMIKENKNKRQRPPNFKTELFWQRWPHFHGKAIRGRLAPVRKDPTDSLTYLDLLASPTVDFVEEIRDYLNNVDATFIQIDEDTQSSILSDIEALGYLPNGICFVYHKAAAPYLFCLIGERAQVEKDIKPMLKVITAFQHKYLRRQTRGPQPDATDLKKALTASKSRGMLKHRAHALAESKAKKLGKSVKSVTPKGVEAAKRRIHRTKRALETVRNKTGQLKKTNRG